VGYTLTIRLSQKELCDLFLTDTNGSLTIGLSRDFLLGFVDEVSCEQTKANPLN
jgi:hypothetical protein